MRVGWLVLSLLILATISQLLNFAIAAAHQRRLRTKLADWYVAVQVGNWRVIPIFAAKFCDAFFSSILGREFFSVRAIVIATGISMVGYSTLPHVIGSHFSSPVLVPVMAIAEAYVLAKSREALRYWLTTNPPEPLSSAVTNIVVVPYTVVILVWLLTRWLDRGFDSFPIAVMDTLTGAGERSNILRLLIIAFPTCDLIFATIIITQAVYLTRELSRAPISWVLEKLESAHNGLLGTTALGLMTIAALLSAFEGVEQRH